MPRIDRRHFLLSSGAVGASAFLPGFFWPRMASASTGKMVAQEKWAGFHQLADGVWAVISTPLESDDWTTGCNGGLIAGRDRVLAIESYVRPEGARWVRQTAAELTGRAPTDVVITHYHGDHANGLEGFGDEHVIPMVHCTAKTRELVLGHAGHGNGGSGLKKSMLDAATLIPADEPREIDLGGRVVRLVPRDGHTASDVSIEIEGSDLVFWGDLLWNQLFPNYVDATPSRLIAAVRATFRKTASVHVPGHGPLASSRNVGEYIALLDAVEEAARMGHAGGMSAADAALHELPEPAASWTRFNPAYFERAIGAWYRELAG